MALDHDPAVVSHRVSDIQQALRALTDLARQPLETYLEDPHKVGSSRYHLIVAVEACLDLANHIIAKNRFRVPEDNADTFRVLTQEDLIEEDLAARLEDMARFRNLLVHRYGTVDDERVHTIMGEDLADLERFIQSLGKALEG